MLMAIAGFGALAVHPLFAARTDQRRFRSSVGVLQEIADLRTSLSAWQVFIGPHFGDFSTAAARIDATELARGAVLAQTQSTKALAVIALLETHGLAGNAQQIQIANVSYNASIAKFGALDGGATPAVIVATISTETDAFSRMMAVTASTGDQVRAQSTAALQASVDRLDASRRAFLVADGILAALVLVGAVMFGQRARRRERVARREAEGQAFETAFLDALEMAKTESDVYGIMTDALAQTVAGLQVQMLVADSSRAHFHQTLETPVANGAPPRSGCGVVSPFDCPATRRSHTLVFPKSGALNACPHLKGRDSGALSAACVPISITGQTSGVVHATGLEGIPPTATQVHYVETTSRLGAERIALLRAFEKSETQARTDPLTGLWNRRSFENRVRELVHVGTPYTLAYGDLDHFKVLNDTHGHEAGDQALRLFARVLRDSVRPDDVTARYGGEEFVIVLPGCPLETATKVLERLRERLALTVNAGRVPAFTVSFGLASSDDGSTFDEVVAAADHALLIAKSNGRNRTVRVADLEGYSHPAGLA